MKDKLFKINLQMFNDEENDTTTINGDGQPAQEPEVKTYTQEQVDNMIKKRLARQDNKFEKEFKNSEEYKAYGEWKEAQKTEGEKIRQQVEDYNNLKSEFNSLQSELNAYRNKDILRSQNIEDKYLDYVNFEVSKNVTEEKDYQTALNEYLEANPHYGKGESKSKLTTGQRHSNINSEEADLDTLRRQMGLFPQKNPNQ